MTWRRRSTHCGTSATTIPARRFLFAGRSGADCARLFLARAIGQIIRNGLAIMGVEAVEEMH